MLHSFTCARPVSPESCFEDAVFFPIYTLDFFVKDKVAISTCGLLGLRLGLMWIKLMLNFQSSCLHLQSAGMTGEHHYVWLPICFCVYASSSPGYPQTHNKDLYSSSSPVHLQTCGSPFAISSWVLRLQICLMLGLSLLFYWSTYKLFLCLYRVFFLV